MHVEISRGVDSGTELVRGAALRLCEGCADCVNIAKETAKLPDVNLASPGLSRDDRCWGIFIRNLVRGFIFQAKCLLDTWRQHAAVLLNSSWQ